MKWRQEMTVKLICKPCPFCGEEKDIRQEKVAYDSNGKAIIGKRKDGLPDEYIVKCGKCWARTITAETKEDAYAYWQAGLFDETTQALNTPGHVDTGTNWTNLRDAIVLKAFNDYKEELIEKKTRHKRGAIKGEKWFRSQELAAYTMIPGDAIIRAAKEQADYDIWREEHGCKSCKKEECIHATSYPWIAFKNHTAPDCLVFRGGFVDDIRQYRVDMTVYRALQKANGVESSTWTRTRYLNF